MSNNLDTMPRRRPTHSMETGFNSLLLFTVRSFLSEQITCLAKIAVVPQRLRASYSLTYSFPQKSGNNSLRVTVSLLS